ncbi:hypothetical protein [Pseudoalteromonas fuliginea]|uniref:Uncharacterized protein n=1 Tax=Pseudoalteromonas fuliginea TaxID=1872678 RepID=A0ABD3Y3B5_9GAMM|nr:hypothetical protein [Pseudoalteromonas fuliginea]KDC47601.1 hypothetical protein DC53_21045 [Pseudoalteromonas fuliginea]KJZ21619.1 hypothetical protein TW82_20175 [Pseudoalteromonas fuliginea]
MNINFKSSKNVSTLNSPVNSTAEYICIFTAPAPKENPYSALFNPEGYDFSNMSMSEFKTILNVIIQLESDIRTTQRGETARDDEFSYQLNKLANAIGRTNFNGKVNINKYFLKRVEEAKKMESSDFHSFSQVHTSMNQLYETVVKLTSEENFTALQNKAIAYLEYTSKQSA